MNRFINTSVRLLRLTLVVLLPFFLFACADHSDETLSSNSYKVFLTRQTELSDPIHRVDMFLFDEAAQIDHKLEDRQPAAGFYQLSFDKDKIAQFTVIANNEDVALQNAIISGMSYEAMAQLQTTPVDYATTFPALYYTATKATKDITSSNVEIDLLRSLSRVDVRIITDVELSIDSCIITNLIDRTSLLPGCALTPSAQQLKTVRFDAASFSDIATSKLLTGLTYLYESRGVKPLLTFYVKIQGVKTKLTAELPATIERNKKYEIAINGRGATLFTQLSILDWEQGDVIDAIPTPFQPLIDLENSILPATVRISDKQDTLFLPPCSSSFELAIMAGVEVEIRVEDPDLNIVPLTRSTATYQGSKFSFEVAQQVPGAATTISRIYVKDKLAQQHYGHHITVVREGSRLKFAGLEGVLAADGVYYGDYADGLLATITTTMPPVRITCESLDSQFNWLRLDETEEGIYQLHGGFKPNDIHANGQQQISRLTATFADGIEHVYDFSRYRTSIPVIYINGRYWAKYNMRGNSKIADDQISFNEDKEDLWSFFQTCTDEEFLHYAGSDYKGRSTQGLVLAPNEYGTLAYADYETIANADLYNAPNDTHCPAGYLMPSSMEIGSILTTNGTLSFPADGASTLLAYSTTTGQRFNIRRYKRGALNISGLLTGDVYALEITEQASGAKLYFPSVGHQWSVSASEVDNLSWGYSLLGATHGNSRYFSFEHSANRAQMQSHGSAKTRNIRCIKSPVEFIVEE